MYATMGAWERMPLRSHLLLLFPPKPRRLPGYIRRTSASAHTSGPEGCALHAAFIPRCAYKLVVVMAHKNLLAVKEPRQCLRAHGYRTRGRRGTDLEADKTRRMFLSGKAQGCLNQCKANRSASKQFPKLKRKRDKIAESRFYDGLV